MMLLTGESALHIAIVYGEFEMVKQLVESGVNITPKSHGEHSCTAIVCGEFEMVK